MIDAVPPFEPRVHGERRRAESFGSLAELYDRYRPSYPGELVDDLMSLGASDVLDVGCGTGKAGRLLGDRGLPVLGVEIDAQMAAVARAHGLEVEVASFEAWEPAGRRFDLLICGQAWHWVDPGAGVPKAATVLRPGGTLALFWNSSRLTGEVKAEIDGVYRYRAPDLLQRTPSVEDEPPYGDDLYRSRLFEKPFSRTYTWEHAYSTEEWVQLAQTHSDHALLSDRTRAALVADVADVIDAHGGRLVASYTTYAVLAHVPSP
jgi:SAM-dependent methyltransferase